MIAAQVEVMAESELEANERKSDDAYSAGSRHPMVGTMGRVDTPPSAGLSRLKSAK